jgi:hypothetical protein
MSINVESINPQFDVNYKKGYVGFTYYNTSVLSKGIAYMTRWAKMSDIKVSHTLIITGKDECIEAHIKEGVVRSTLSKYFDDANCQIFFRKPVGLTSDIANRIEAVAAVQVGTKYDTKLIAAQAAHGGILGKLVNRVFHGKPDRLVSKLLNRDDRWICSELVAYCLDEQPEYRDKGILHDPKETIDPQELFEDTVIFEPWKRGI